MANIDEVTQDPQGPKKPSIATVKSVLDRSKESKQFSQYKKKEKPLEIKATPTPTFTPPNPDPLSIIGATSKPYETNVKADVIPSTATISKEFKTNPLQDQTWKFDEMTHKFTTQVPISVKDAVENTVSQAYSGRFQPTLKKDDFAKDLTIKVQNGDYTIKDGIVRKKDEGALETSLNAYADMFGKTSEAKDYFIMPRDKKKEYLMNWYKNLPTQIQPEVQHETAQMVGSMGAQVTGAMAATGLVTLGTSMTALSGATLAPVLMPVASSLLVSAYNTLGTELDYEKQTFKNAMDKGLDTDISFNAVEGGRPTYLTTTFAENAILNYAGIRAQGALTGLQKESGNTLLKYLKNIGTVRIPEAVGSAGFSGGMEYLRADKMKSVTGADIDPSEQAKDVFYQGLYLQGMFNGVGALWGSTKILANKAIKSAILNHAANQDAAFVDNMLKQYRQQGQLTEEQYVMFNKDLADFKAAKKANPDVNSGKVPEPKVPAVVGLGIKKKNLQAAAQDADGSARAELEARIQDVDERIKRAIAGMDDGLEGEIDDITMNPVNRESAPSGTKKFIVDGAEVTEEEFNKATGKKQIINEDATTTTQEQQQAGQTTGDISKYKGAEGEQAPPTNEANNSNSTVSGEKKKVIPDSFDSRQGIAEIDAMDGIISRMNYDVGSKKLWRQNVSEAILKHLQKSELYNQADDIAREQMYRDAQKYFFNKQFKSAPTADKILGQVSESFTTNDKAAFKSLFKTTKNTIDWVNRTRDEIKAGLQDLSKRGKIKASALTSVLNKYSNLDFSNDIAINKFVDHVSNIINVADYDTKISQAQKLRTSISRMAKSKDAQGNLTKAAREFAKIDPETVSELEIYMAKANEVSNGITPNRKKSQVFNIDDVSKYIDNEKTALSEKMKSQKMADYQDLVDKGILTTDMSLQDIEFIVKSIDEGADPSTIDANKMKAVQDYNKVKFPGLAAIAKSILGTGNDGFGNKVEVNMSPEDKVLLQDVLKVGIKNMSPKNAFKVNAALENFIVNGEHYGLEKVLREHYGERAGAYAEQAKIKAKPFNSYENISYNLVGSLPQTFSNYFAGNTMKVQTSSGFTGFKSAAANADELTSQLIKELRDKFKKVKPNGLHLLDENNIAEQGLYSHMIRNSGGTPEELAAHFKDRKGPVSYTHLRAHETG
jgi:hypothetical protein